MNVGAMQQLVRVMEEVVANKLPLNMSQWVADHKEPTMLDSLVAIDGLKDDYKLLPLSCGTAACACGYAALDPWFRERGFEFYIDQHPTIVYYDEHGHMSLHWDAVQRMFGLDNRDSQYLFSGAAYHGSHFLEAAYVLNRIKTFMTNKGVKYAVATE